MIALSTRGKPLNLEAPLVARVHREGEANPKDPEFCVLVTEDRPKAGESRFAAVLTSATLKTLDLPGGLPAIHSAGQLRHLQSGDVVVLHPRRGQVRTLFRRDANYNSLLVTERCNSYCLMCSQPPIARDDSELVDINIRAIQLMDPAPAWLGITGGEPTLLGEGLFRILAELQSHLPEAEIQMLTNGRRFAWPDFTAEFIEKRHPRLRLGIPVYADNAGDHDYVVQARGAFDQTIMGLHQLARYEQPVEIRVVLHALTVPRLKQLAEFIYRNLTFAAHVAFMGLEVTGFTKPNLNELWIDPYDYKGELAEAVEYLAIRGMNVSIYNLQLCVIDRSVWSFSRKSISDWKNTYLDACSSCRVRAQCGGLFETGLSRISAHLAPL